jgi:hypothetical protein
MENSKEITASRSDVASLLELKDIPFIKIHGEKISKIDFFVSECKLTSPSQKT